MSVYECKVKKPEINIISNREAGASEAACGVFTIQRSSQQ